MERRVPLVSSMRMYRAFSGITIAAALLLASFQPGHAASQSETALNRLIALDSSIHSYVADVRADIAMHSFPFLSPSLTGVYYHKAPNKDKIVFTGGVPLIAQQFNNLYPHLEPPSHWTVAYNISTVREDGTFVQLKLIPKDRAHIDHIDAKIAVRSGELVQMRWNYTDGGYALLNQSYGKIGNYTLVTQQSGHFQDPNYNADVNSRFTNFKLNAAIPDSVFTQ